MVLKHLDQPKSFRATTKFSLHYVVPLVFLILTYIPAQNHATVFEETQANHADYDLEMYQLFGGFADSHHFCMTFNTILLAISTVYGPIMGAVWKRYALKVLLSNTMSHPSRVMLETLIKSSNIASIVLLCPNRLFVYME
uniref:Uncharacterized protein n=1 Tax=Caenorhabditis japonica TaxID=281687 RepID=A0A8R1HZ37_CAEJA